LDLARVAEVAVTATMYFEETLRDRGGAGEPIKFEVGCSTYYGESLVYLVVDGRVVVLDQATGERLLDAIDGLNTVLRRVE
jgi:hypothetical protein